MQRLSIIQVPCMYIIQFKIVCLEFPNGKLSILETAFYFVYMKNCDYHCKFVSLFVWYIHYHLFGIYIINHYTHNSQLIQLVFLSLPPRGFWPHICMNRRLLF